MGRWFLKWELHTEFVTYTVFADGVDPRPFSGEMFDLFPADWLAAAPGKVVTSALVRIESAGPAEVEERSPATCRMVRAGEPGGQPGGRRRGGDRRGLPHRRAWAQPAAGAGGAGIGQRRLGRIVQRLLEIETYKCMAMLTLPLAREVAARWPASTAS